jgi:hypothetical protein
VAAAAITALLVPRLLSSSGSKTPTTSHGSSAVAETPDPATTGTDVTTGTDDGSGSGDGSGDGDQGNGTGKTVPEAFEGTWKGHITPTPAAAQCPVRNSLRLLQWHSCMSEGLHLVENLRCNLHDRFDLHHVCPDIIGAETWRSQTRILRFVPSSPHPIEGTQVLAKRWIKLCADRLVYRDVPTATAGP